MRRSRPHRAHRLRRQAEGPLHRERHHQRPERRGRARDPPMQHRRRRRGQRGRRQRAADRHHGGQIRALQAVRGTIGSPAGVPTLVQAGLDPRRHQAHGVDAQAREDERGAKLEQLLLFLHTPSAPPATWSTARATPPAGPRPGLAGRGRGPAGARPASRSTQPASHEPALLQRREDPDRQQDAGIPGRPGWRQGRAGSRRDRHPLNPARAGDADRSRPARPGRAVRRPRRRRPVPTLRRRRARRPAPARRNHARGKSPIRPQHRKAAVHRDIHPVIHDAASEHAKHTAAAISSPDPTRPSGWKCAHGVGRPREPPASCSTERRPGPGRRHRQHPHAGRRQFPPRSSW